MDHSSSNHNFSYFNTSFLYLTSRNPSSALYYTYVFYEDAVGFEPTVLKNTRVFKTPAFDHSAIHPLSLRFVYITNSIVNPTTGSPTVTMLRLHLSLRHYYHFVQN